MGPMGFRRYWVCGPSDAMVDAMVDTMAGVTVDAMIDGWAKSATPIPINSTCPQSKVRHYNSGAIRRTTKINTHVALI